jgi:hypothetical protein
MNHQKEKQIDGGDKDFGGRISQHNQTRGLFSRLSPSILATWPASPVESLRGCVSEARRRRRTLHEEDEHGASSITHRNRSINLRTTAAAEHLSTHTKLAADMPPLRTSRRLNLQPKKICPKSTNQQHCRKNHVNGDTKYTCIDPQRIQPDNRHASTARHTDDPNNRGQQ